MILQHLFTGVDGTDRETEKEWSFTTQPMHVQRMITLKHKLIV